MPVSSGGSSALLSYSASAVNTERNDGGRRRTFREMTLSPDRIAHWQELTVEQSRVADAWIEIGDALHSYGDEEAALKFIAYFSALNALYWLYGCINAEDNNQRNRFGELRTPSARHLIGHVIETRLPPGLADELARSPEVEAAVHSFLQRPVRNMEAREHDGSGKSPSQRLLTRLAGPPSLDRLRAAGEVLFQIRCNLVHGAKILSVRDMELLAVAVPLLERLVKAAASFARSHRVEGGEARIGGRT